MHRFFSVAGGGPFRHLITMVKRFVSTRFYLLSDVHSDVYNAFISLIVVSRLLYVLF